MYHMYVCSPYGKTTGKNGRATLRIGLMHISKTFTLLHHTSVFFFFLHFVQNHVVYSLLEARWRL